MGRTLKIKLKIIWYHFSEHCNILSDNEGDLEYLSRPVHIIREIDGECMACCKSQEDAARWLKEYSERMKPDFILQNMR